VASSKEDSKNFILRTVRSELYMTNFLLELVKVEGFRILSATAFSKS